MTVVTTEQQMHHALQNSLWVSSPEYSLMASSEQLQSTIREYGDQRYEGPDAKDRPALFLAGNILKQHLLIHLKRPPATVGRMAEAQANEYADTLTGRLSMSLQILIIGREVDPKLQDEYTGKKSSFAAYCAIIASARRQLDWLIEQLNRPPA